MKTSDVLASITLGDPRPKSFRPAVTVMLAAVIGLFLVLALSLALLPPRADLFPAFGATDHVVLLKFAFTAGVVGAAIPIVMNLSAPGRSLPSWRTLAALLPFLFIVGLAARELLISPVGETWKEAEHADWFACLWQIPAFALPAFLALVIGVRRLAPTNLLRTGAFIGLFAGGVGGIAYAMHCNDDNLAFVAIGYTVAIVEMVLVGAILGPYVLRWR